MLCSQLWVDIVAKVFLGGRTKFFRAADAFYERRREGPYRFIQNRPATSVVALKSDTGAEKSKDQLSPEIFRVARFSTFATISVKSGLRPKRVGSPLRPEADRSLDASNPVHSFRVDNTSWVSGAT